MDQDPNRAESPSPARRAARLVLDAFEDYNARFADITRRARRRFEQRDRAGMQADTVERIELYDLCVRETFSRLEALLAGRLFARGVWRAMRGEYAALVEPLLDAELYKTFFNTLSRRFFRTRGVDPELEFVALDIEPTDRITHPVARHNYAVSDNLAEVCRRLLADYAFRVPFADLAGDARCLAERLERDLAAAGEERPLAIELLQTVFYRDGRAYLVGRAFGARRYLPCVIALRNTGDGVRADALLTRHRQLSVLFGYTQSYFHADLPTVGDTVVFLRTLLPHKPLDELYTVLGRLKQGKTERYRRFFRHLDAARGEQLVPAEGERGLVMAVFTLPSYPLVFKLIRDRFGPAKPFTRDQVMERYRLVFRHARVGRLVDAQEFRALRFPLARFSAELLRELRRACAGSLNEDGGDLVITHCYVERRVRPLNLYLAEVEQAAAREAVLDYGQVIKDLAHSDIFAGDLLLKNFGVTRTGRVVFYDYDELRLVRDCRFRAVPPPRSEEEALSDEPWYPVEEGDVFPELFPRFMGLKPAQIDWLRDSHGELFDPAWWRAVQEAIRRGDGDDVPPYPPEVRLAHE